MTQSSRGPNERQTRRAVKTLGPLSGLQMALAETAFTLARKLDQDAGLATAAVARELRATLLSLREVGDVNAAGADLQARLSAPVVNPEDFGPRLVGLKSRRGGGDAGDAPDAVAAPRSRGRPGDRPGD